MLQPKEELMDFDGSTVGPLRKSWTYWNPVHVPGCQKVSTDSVRVLWIFSITFLTVVASFAPFLSRFSRGLQTK